MIIPNGTVEFIANSGGGIDADGYPVESVKSYGPPVPCQYKANNHNSLGKTNGETFTRASYWILIEWLEPTPGLTELLRLKSRSGRVVGEFPVLQFDPLEAVCQMRIIV
jgi:hypothetical protein